MEDSVDVGYSGRSRMRRVMAFDGLDHRKVRYAWGIRIYTADVYCPPDDVRSDCGDRHRRYFRLQPGPKIKSRICTKENTG